jgi:dTDP-4-amino-4,6-dideoxygalactose transaminase
MKLAIHGGQPVRTVPFPCHRTIGDEERAAVDAVLAGGVLSKFLGCRHEDFLGGPEVRRLEEEWARHFGARHAVAVNSCTSGLICALGAAGIEPGDEVIVPPYTMSASATSILVWGGIPVFADVEPDCFCLDPESVAANITPHTRAIVAVDLFGQPYDREAIAALAQRHGLTIVEDAAQAPGAVHQGRFAGTLGRMGVYSLNYHKHIHCGEGGLVVTDDDVLAERLRLIRNHAESVVDPAGPTGLVNMVGFNFRMTEMEAAVSRCQLAKLEGLLAKRRANIRFLEERLAAIPALTPPAVRPGCEHAYYCHAYRYDEAVAGVHRNRFLEAVRAELPVHAGRESEGVKIGGGYVAPLYRLPLYQQRLAFGASGWPFSAARRPLSYADGLCPVTERLHERELFTHEMMVPSMVEQDLLDVVAAFQKVWEHLDALR